MILLFSSIFFYMCSGPVFLAYILSVSFFTWYGARKLEEQRTGRKLLLAVLIFINIGILLIVKWSGMELAFVNRLFGTALAWKLVLPLGMSFFTFQNVSYIVDIYRGKVAPEKNFWHYLLYASYFPYIVSGPINRYEKIGSQLVAGHSFDKDTFYQGMLRILWGYIKKMVIADRAAVFVDEVFGHYYMYRGLFIIFAVLLFSLQLYMDFSGCMDIVLGVSKLFGIEMAENFRVPYGAVTTSEFWRRWHMSLTSWFRDYLYIPLGGNRKGTVRKYLNIMVVFLFCGMWHGAGITFLIWGFLNGLYQVVGSMTVKIRKKICQIIGLDEYSHGAVLRKKLITAVLIEFAWLFFRADGCKEAFVMLRRMFTGWNPWILTDGTLYQAGLDQWDFMILIVGAVGVGWVSRAGNTRNLHNIFRSQSWLCQTLIILAALVIWYLFGIYGPGFDPVNFLYYNF
ncbi:MAG: hypothetical protein NC231_13695 [Bacillus sp. (in: Bacteria)]|nr:hypothetical protein [Bacillus sp. (in: firmicutes)]MCM1427657.1 MBOAT family protein [Eubacterium sp.]